MVEVLGRYSNHADQGIRINGVLQTPLSKMESSGTEPRRQIHRRLLEEEINEVVEAYLAGATVYELSDRYHIHRARISLALERRGVPRRYRMVEGDRLQ